MSELNTTNPASLNIDPFLFLELEKTELIYKLINEMGLSEEEALAEFNAMVKIITRLKPLRNCQSKTDDYLAVAVKEARYRVKVMVIMILLKATENSDTWGYAYNTLVYFANRYLRLNLKRKKIVEANLLFRLKQEMSAAKPALMKASQPKLSLSQIALKHVWEGSCISLETCSQIAREYGYSSGNALYNRFCTYSSSAYRKASSDLSRKQLRNKINLFESVIDLLPESKKKNPLAELNHLLTKLEEDY